ncbi:MAG TPA: acetolactate synthase large subunit, partial [Oxalobacteraceae bacterium]|nr:acetolactate synthase large subunit [Oxalobacteraceae bacterium]
VALATGAVFVPMQDNDAIAGAIRRANEIACTGRPVIVDVRIDYSKRTAFTEGAVKTNFRRFPLTQKVRTLARALTRRVTG